MAQHDLLCAVELDAAHVQIHEEDRVDVVAQRDDAHVIQAAHEQTCPNEQYDR